MRKIGLEYVINILKTASVANKITRVIDIWKIYGNDLKILAKIFQIKPKKMKEAPGGLKKIPK